MADQDFNINIRTTADTAAVARMEAALTALGAKVNSITAVGGGDGGGGGGGNILDKAATKIEHGIFRTAVHAIGIGVVYEMVAALREQAEELEKVSDELDKQGDKLVKNARLYAEATRFATNQADIIKIGAAAMKDVEAAHEKVIHLQNEELSLWAKFSDIVNSIAHDTEASDETYAAAQKANIAAAETLETTARQNTYDDIRAAKITAARRATQSYAETIAELTARMKEQQALADTHWANKDVESYLSAAKAADSYGKEIEEVKKKLKKDTGEAEENFQKTYGAAGGQAQLILTNEENARRAAAAGDPAAARRYQESAEGLKRGATPAERSNYEILNATLKQTRVLEQMLEQWR